MSKVRRIWPCQGGEGHFMARLVKAGTPRTLPAPGEYTPEEQLWLAAAAEAGKKAKGSKPQKAAKPADARSARRENSRSLPGAVQGRSSRSREAGAGGCIARPEPCCMEGVCGWRIPGAGKAPCRGAWRRRPAAGGFSADESSRFACRRLRGQCAEGALCAGTSSVHGFRRALPEL